MKIQKLQNYKPKDTRKAVPTHYTLLFDAYDPITLLGASYTGVWSPRERG